MRALFKQIFDGGAFFTQFAFGRVHFFTAEGVDVEALDDFVVAVFAAAGVGVDDAGGDAVGAVGRDAHADPVVAVGAQRPGAHVVNRGRSGRSSGGCAARLDDGSTALLYDGDEGVFVPAVFNQAFGGFALHGGVADVRVLGGGVVAPDGHLGDVGAVRAGFFGELRQRAVVVKAYGAGVSRQQIADILGYHLNSVSRWIREFEREKWLEARPRGHRVAIFSEAERLELVELIGKQPDIT